MKLVGLDVYSEPLRSISGSNRTTRPAARARTSEGHGRRIFWKVEGGRSAHSETVVSMAVR